MGNRFSHSARPVLGFTLLELMLALGLTTVILMALSMAIDLHLRSFDSRRKQLEESQLARAILTIIAEDIRNTVLEYEMDMSGLEQMLASAATSAASGALEDVLGSGIASTDLASTDLASTDLASTDSAATQDLSSQVTLPPKPGIYGNQYQLQLDVSRLPRYDEYQDMLAANRATGLVDIPSDIKTVTYYVKSPDSTMLRPGTSLGTQDASISTDPNVVRQGLVRRQLDRAVSQYALANGLLTTNDNASEVIAPEVAAIEFQYFDGTTWRYEWDTATEGALPLAIQIVLLLEPPSAKKLMAADVASPLTANAETSTLHYYRLLVPVATGVTMTKAEDTSLEAAGL